MGKSIVQFNDFFLATNENKFTEPTDIINDVVSRTLIMADAMRGRDNDELVQNGSTITDRRQSAAATGFSFYDPFDQFSPSEDDTLSKLQAPWRFAKDVSVWTDHEIELNTGDRRIQFEKLAKSKRQARDASTIEGMEAAIMAAPNQNTMEILAGSGGRPYSLLCFAAENGIQPSGWTTTILQNDPVADTTWRNPVENYASGSLDVTLLGAMERMWLDLNFKSIGEMPELYRDTDWKKFKIYTNTDGYSSWVRLTRQGNDRNFPSNDAGWAINSVDMGGVKVEKIDSMDNIGYALGQPRFMWINYKYLFPVWNSKRYMKEISPRPSPFQPFVWCSYSDTWYNWFCRSRKARLRNGRRHLIVPKLGPGGLCSKKPPGLFEIFEKVSRSCLANLQCKILGFRPKAPR